MGRCVDVPVCVDVPRKQCSVVTVQVPVQVPVQKCADVPKQVCHPVQKKVAREVCQTVAVKHVAVSHGVRHAHATPHAVTHGVYAGKKPTSYAYGVGGSYTK